MCSVVTWTVRKSLRVGFQVKWVLATIIGIETSLPSAGTKKVMSPRLPVLVPGTYLDFNWL